MELFKTYLSAFSWMYEQIFHIISEEFPSKYYDNCCIIHEYYMSGTIIYEDLFFDGPHKRIYDDVINAGSAAYYRKFQALCFMVLGHLEPLFKKHGDKLDGLQIRDYSSHLDQGLCYIRHIFRGYLMERMNFEMANQYALKSFDSKMVYGTPSFEFYSKSIMYLQLKHISTISDSLKDGLKSLKSNDLSDDDDESGEILKKLLLDNTDQTASTSCKLKRQISIISIK
ncbi:putative protein [Actinidia chlorotic ringspot-associated virus]|uniref:Uncharacterized protein n=1 Tax=Actinidia chlorotic ringspot-associated virus TaxID=1776763 RepID=A0A0U4B558_9VIRU|nr:putative protein [Actinidia chlorotic ringspot-associated virus]ALX00131.1 putative protein [Actinidia chlorotic ringspot-associated virus]QJD14765.1 hypothetical protein [Actinidia chlorotic ringspot-associated virus]UKM63457.1 MAG: hypothetical protein [Actinidia chlorotic ringspot-associated virus]WAJ62797.1 hypothetical protein [Actinidia chlorotic ringspot-associated virus]WAJ62798.1 hypothetical protein [Actinidia chlorotic ringspot-associated virus]